MSRTSASKFLSAATFTHTHPSFSAAVGTLYVALGTADTTTSESARHRARSNSGGAGLTTWCGWYARRVVRSAPAPSPDAEDATATRLVYSCTESMSTEKTRAPSFARSAASGRPTTSDLSDYQVGKWKAWGGNAPVDYGDGPAVCAVAVWQERIVYSDTLERFDYAQRRAR